jgi:integrase
MKISPILYSRPLSNGKHQIKIRIHSNEKTKYITTKFSIDKKEWDTKRRRVKELKSIPNHEQINDEINRLEKLYRGENIPVDNDSQYDFKLFIQHFNKIIELLVAQEKYNTYRKLKVVKNHLIKFQEQNQENITINRIFLDEFRIYLFKVVKLKQNGVHTYFKVFRNTLNKVINSSPSNFSIELNPFINYKIKLEKKNKPKLSHKEFNKLTSLELETNSSLWHTKNLFLFSFYSAGMRVSDILMLKWSNFKDGRLKYTMRKTGKELSLPMNKKQVAILLNYLPFETFEASSKEITDKTVNNINSSLKQEKTIITYHNKTWRNFEIINKPIDYKPIFDTNQLTEIPSSRLEVIQLMGLKRGNDLIFPYLDASKTKNKTENLKQISSKTALINKQLKNISVKCDIGVNLTFHIARHTLSDMMRTSKVGLYDISQILGHSDIATTQKYLRSIDENTRDKTAINFYNNL